MPAVRMAPIVDQIRRAKRWVDGHIESHGGDPGKLTVSGHSAGAHLATMLFDDDSRPSGIKGALLLGGIYDLRPLQESFLAPEIAITDEEVERFSPIDHRFDPSVTVQISRMSLASVNHMSSVRDLGVPDTDAARSLVHLLRLKSRRCAHWSIP
ncbi:carboxylesterase family protein [Mesorhizobium sp. WSM3866]|uniref:alpha/beta hydrolase n=1 Tax=Mesorhizobium sp. WSM3866 TaxID=422271 RepID=UPI0026BB2136